MRASISPCPHLQRSACLHTAINYPHLRHSALIGARTHLPDWVNAWSRGVYAGSCSLHSPHPSYHRSVGIAAVSAGEVLAGQALVLSSYDEELFEPSHDLRELASAQLQLMFQMLARISPTDAVAWRACVYARRADSLEAPQIRLQRVACWPSRIQQPATQWSSAATAATEPTFGSFSSAASNGDLDDMLTLHRPAWEGGSSSATCDAEASLVQEEMVILPNSNLLVLPLAEAGVLVGLLVVEVAESLSPATAVHGHNTSNRGSSSSGVTAISEDALWCLRTAVPPLAKACAMDLRAALAGAQQEAQQRLARSLLTEARGPLKVLGTFGAMLAPRLRANSDNQSESDMADGMVMQGQRLADVVAQLEAALRPATLAAAGGATWQQQLALPAADDIWVADAAIDEYADVPAAGTGSKQQQPLQKGPQQMLKSQQVPAASMPAVGSAAGYLPESCSSSSSSSSVSNGSCNEDPHHQQQQQQTTVQAPHLPGQWVQPAGPLQTSSRDIRWSGVQVEPTVAHPVAETSSSINNGAGTCGSYYPAAAAGSGMDVQKTIDMEPATLDVPQAFSAEYAPGGSDSGTTARAISPDAVISIGSSSSSKPKRQRQRQEQQPVLTAVQRSLCCNLAEALSHLLTAASRLAQVQGVNFIVNHPLQLDQPITGTSSHTRKHCAVAVQQSPDLANSRNSSSSDGSAEEPAALLPRPVRPLLVGLAPGTCRRVLGYVLDVALQCTPRGGQLCVTARQCSGGVEVNVLHTGHAQPSRMHTTSKTLNHKLYSQLSSGLTSSNSGGSVQRRQFPQDSVRSITPPSSDSSSSSKAGVARSAGGGVQDLASSSSLHSSSSLVSLDFAGQVLRSIGGRLSVVYPCHFMNAISGQLEVGSSIEVWLPPPATAAH